MSIPRQVLAGAAAADAVLNDMRNAANPPAPQPPPEPPKPEPPPPPAEDWKARAEAAQHRVKVTEGITRTQGEEIRELHAQVKQLKADLEAAKAAPPKPEPDLTKYDPEILEMVGHLVDKRTASVQREVEESRADREKRMAAEAKAHEEGVKKAEFVDFMDEFVPGWRGIDNDPDFATYLSSTDPATGEQVQAAYMDAFQRIDGRAMARVFKRYLATKAAAPAQPPSPPVVPPVSGRVELDDAQPGRIWTVAEVDAFYADEQKGRLKQRGWDRKRIEATEKDILAAYSEGRVRR